MARRFSLNPFSRPLSLDDAHGCPACPHSPPPSDPPTTGEPGGGGESGGTHGCVNCPHTSALSLDDDGPSVLLPLNRLAVDGTALELEPAHAGDSDFDLDGLTGDLDL